MGYPLPTRKASKITLGSSRSSLSIRSGEVVDPAICEAHRIILVRYGVYCRRESKSAMLQCDTQSACKSLYHSTQSRQDQTRNKVLI